MSNLIDKSDGIKKDIYQYILTIPISPNMPMTARTRPGRKYDTILQHARIPGQTLPYH